jgi:hypothetical protein
VSSSAATTRVLDREAQNALLRAAQTAPSGDNCQPLRYRWQGDRLAITVNQSRAAHALNFHDTATLLSLGATLECLVIEATRFGLEARIELVPAEARSPSLSGERAPPSAVVQFSFDGRERDPLASYLSLRRTDRRPFRGGELPPAVVDSAPIDGAAVHWLERGEPGSSGDRALRELAKVAAKIEMEMWRDPNVHRDFYRWLRFGNAADRTGDGMPMATLAISSLESIAIRLGKSFAFQSLVNATGGLLVARRHTEMVLASSAALFCVTAPRPESPASPASLLDLCAVGRLALRTWLRLAAIGFGVQPHTLTSHFAFGHLAGLLPRGSRWDTRGREGLAALSAAFAIPEDRTPVWLFRTGDVRGLPPPAHCPRLPTRAVTD